jgi:hypothetical protein
MKQLTDNIMKLIQIVRGDCVVLTVKGDTLIVDAGNKSAEEVKTLASTFFKKAYMLSNK